MTRTPTGSSENAARVLRGLQDAAEMAQACRVAQGDRLAAVVSFRAGEGGADEAVFWEIREIIDGLFGPRDYSGRRTFTSRAGAVAQAEAGGFSVSETLSDP